ncbi:MAG TPA: hypothetical protein VLA56_14320 [Pseudomonadales bacterium]|nr:hypothetical protein [Pseudomonadales bacterium]
MKPSLTRFRSRQGRHLFVGALTVLLALTAPVCQALCVTHGDAGERQAPLAAAAGVVETAAVAHADCHGQVDAVASADASAATGAGDSCCPDHDAASAGERVDVQPALVLAGLWPSAAALPARLPGRFAARLLREVRPSGPPLRLLTLRFLE